MTASRSDEERSTAPSGPARMTTALRTWGSWCGRIVFERIGTARAIAAAAGAWAAIAAAGLPIVIAGLCCALLGAVLVLVHRPATARRSSHRRRASRMIGPVVGGLLAALGLSVLVAGAHALMLEDAPRPEAALVTVVTDPQETQSGRFRSVVTGETGRVTVVSEQPPPPAGSVLRAELDWWDNDLAGLVSAEVREDPGARWRIRADLRAGLADVSGVGTHAGGDLLPGLVVGDVAHIHPALAEAMRTVSLTHLTAVSGSNILIVAGVVVALCARLRSPWWVRILPAAAVTAGYVFIVGPEPSVMRATAMASLVAVGILRPAGTPTLAVLATAVTVLLIGRPHLATEIGFGLSVCATAALVVLSPPLTRALTDRGMPRPVAVALAVPVAAQAGCTPLLVVLDPTVSPWAVLANVAAAPAVAPATVLGLAGLGLEGIAAALPDALGMPPHLLARTAGALGAAAAWWITVIAHGCASLPGAALGWPTGPGGVVVAAGMVAGLACALLGRRRARTAGALVAVSCLLAGLAVPVVTATGRGAWSIVVCDVGQGSAALIRSRDAPRDHALLVDTGDDPALLAACMEGAGITRLTIALSHFDADHVAALPAAVEAVDEAVVVHPRALADSPEAARTRAVATVAAPAAAGEELPAALLPAGITARVLWPPADGSAISDGNAASLVLLVEVDGLSILLPGDVGEKQQLRMVQELTAHAPVDVLVAPHHGSADTSPAFFRASAARVGVVSVGAGNTYGHPARKALEAFGPAPVLRTDLCGSIALTAELTLVGGARDCGVPAGR
ncbi:MAG: ComEC/Rec2 family competence protein [Brevibacterium yomogidense]